MARTEARIRCSIWDDPDFLALTWQAQWLYHAILEQKDLSLCGVLTYTPKRFAKLAPNIKPAEVVRAMDLLRERRFIVLDDDTDELWVRTFVKGDGVISKPNSVIGMAHDFGAIHSQPIRQGLLQGLGQGFLEELPERFDKWITAGFGKRMPQAFLEAFALAYACPPPHAPVPPASSLQPPHSANAANPSSSNLSSVGNPPAEEDGRAAEAVQIVAQRRLVQRLAPDVVERHGPVNDRDGWLARTAERIRLRHGSDLAGMAAEGVSVEAMVSAIEPLSSAPTLEAPLAHPWPDFEWVIDDAGFATERRVSA